MPSIWGELKRRKVLKVAVAYVVLAWILVLVAAIAFPMLGWSQSAVFVIAVLLLIGLPIVLFLAWAYEITPRGLQIDEETVRSKSSGKIIKLQAVIAILVGIIAAYIWVDQFWLVNGLHGDSPEQTAESQDATGLTSDAWFPVGSKESYDIGVDDLVPRQGEPVVYIRSTVEVAEGFGGLGQTVSAVEYRGSRVRLSGWLKSELLSQWAGLWMRVDGLPGRRALEFDNMRERPVVGTTDWQEYEVVLDIPEEAQAIVLGFLLAGEGSLWASGLRISRVSKDVTTTGEKTEIPDLGDALIDNGESASNAQKLLKSAPLVQLIDEAITIKIGIISPKEGSRTPRTGNAHEAAIMLAFDKLGPLHAGSTEVNVSFLTWNDEGNPKLSSDLALKLVREENVAAILGPVNSSATSSVLQALRRENISIPVISSLATAPNLIVSGRRDHNFFRLIFDDAERMAAYATYIQDENRLTGEHQYLFLYENDDYGIGLVTALESNFYSSNISKMTWCDVIRVPDRPHCIDNTLDARLYNEITKGRYFDPAFDRFFAASDFDSVVILGTAPGSLALAKGLESFGTRLSYYFAGGDKRLFDEAPSNSVTIGNPVLDPGRAPSPRMYFEWNKLLDELESKHTIDRSDFVSTTYEAGMVLHGALRTILRDKEAVPPPTDLRRELLTVLSERDFDALEPWRRIRFTDSQLLEPPTAPIYRLGRAKSREDSVQSQPWVDIDLLPRFSLLESPIHVKLTGYFVDEARILLSRMSNGRTDLVQIRDVEFSGGKAEVDFHVFRPGNYDVSLEGVSYTPTSAETRVGWTPVYLISAIAALVGAWIVLTSENLSLRSGIGRIGMGVFTGFVLTFSSLYGNQIAGWFPFPSFGEEPVINALITGFIGGLIGPYMLADVFLGWADMLLQPVGGRRKRRGPSEVVELPNNRKKYN